MDYNMSRTAKVLKEIEAEREAEERELVELWETHTKQTGKTIEDYDVNECPIF